MKRKSAGLLLIALLMGPLSFCASAQQWTLVGPYGATPRWIAAFPSDDQVVLIHDDVGAFRSVDGGVTWSAIDITPVPQEMMIGRWDANSERGVEHSVWSIGSGGSVHRSDDMGLSFQAVVSDLPLSTATACAASDSNPARLYCALYTGDVYRSDDGGASWLNTGAIAGSNRPTGLLVEPGDPLSLFITVRQEGIYRSSDSGASWSPMDTNLGNGVLRHITIAEASLNGHVLYLSDGETLYRSADDGTAWSELTVDAGSGPPDTLSYVFTDPLQPGLVMVGAGAQVFRSIDSGQNWTAHSGWALQDSDYIYASNASPDRWFVTGSWLARTNDGGSSWADVSDSLIGNVNSYPAVTPPGQSNTLITTRGKELIRTDDLGITWNRLSYGWRNIVGIQHHPTAENVLFLATRYGGLLRSDDGGVTWESIYIPASPALVNVDQFSVSRTNPSHIVVGSYGVTLVTFDGGINWTQTATPFFKSLPAYIFVSPADDMTVYHVKPNECWASFDGGLSWQLQSITGLFFFFDAEPDPFDAGRLFVLGDLGSINISEDFGVSWTQHQLDPTADLFTISANPRLPGNLIATGPYLQGFPGRVTIQSFDFFDTWSVLDGSTPRLSHAKFDPNNAGVILGSGGLIGVHRMVVDALFSDHFETPNP